MLLAAPAALWGCSPEGNAGRGTAYTDGLGRTVAISTPARRIVSMGPSNTEILFAIGAGVQVVGRDDYSDVPAEARSLRAVGSGQTLKLETLVALAPDLVLAAQIYAREQVQSLEHLSLPVFLLSNPVTFDGLFENIRLVGELAGRSEQASTLVASLRHRVDAVAGKVRGARSKPRVFYELDATDPTQPWTAGPGTFIQTLIELAGGTNVAGGEAHPFPRLSAETILKLDPEVIVLGDARHGVTPARVAARAGWGTITAIRQGKIHPFDDDLASRPGPRLVDGLEVLARLIHPSLFEEQGGER